MFEAIILITTHLFAFVLGAACIIIFNSYTSRKPYDTNSTRHTNGEQWQHDEKISNQVKKSTQKETVQSPPVKKLEEHKPMVETSTSPVSATPQKQPTQKELKHLQRKEERVRKKQEEFDRKATLAEGIKKQTFNPLISKPADVSYQALAVSDGKLCPCEIGQTQYYRCWEYEGRLFFEFYCDKSKAAKAINNRSAILDPFCVKNPNSVPVDSAKSMVIEEFGELDNDYNVLSKSQIKFE